MPSYNTPQKQQKSPNIHRVLAAIRALEKSPDVQAYIFLQKSLEEAD